MSQFADELIVSLKQAVEHAAGRMVDGTRVTLFDNDKRPSPDDRPSQRSGETK